MKTLSLMLAAGAAFCTCSVALAPAEASELTLKLNGVRSDKGMIMALLLRADTAAGPAKPVGGARQAASQSGVTLSFPDLAPGDYAVMLFHDENGNGQMDQNAFGMPVEGYGFSNNAKASFGPPKFGEMKVTVGADGRVETVATMSY